MEITELEVPQFSVEPANWEADHAALWAIREQVFILEQNVPEEDEHDAMDARSRHVLALDADRKPIGTARLTPERMIGRMAVLAKWRGKGVGAAMLRVLLEQARESGYPEVGMHAQSHAVGFYERFGFVAEGEEFDECGIAHRLMRREITPLAKPDERPLTPLPERLRLTPQDREAAVAAILHLLDDAQYEVSILTQDLDPLLLDVIEVLDAIQSIALTGRRARIRVLVRDPHKATGHGHRLIALAQRLPSTIELRVPQEEHDLAEISAYLLNDRHGYLYRPNAARAEGTGSTCAPGRHARLLAHFDGIWERSLPDAELRALVL